MLISRRLSFIPQDSNGNSIDPNIISDRHRNVVEFINSPENYLNRNLEYLTHRKRKPLSHNPVSASALMSLARSFYHQGISSYGIKYFDYLAKVLKHDPSDFPDAVDTQLEAII